MLELLYSCPLHPKQQVDTRRMAVDNRNQHIIICDHFLDGSYVITSGSLCVWVVRCTACDALIEWFAYHGINSWKPYLLYEKRFGFVHSLVTWASSSTCLCKLVGVTFCDSFNNSRSTVTVSCVPTQLDCMTGVLRNPQTELDHTQFQACTIDQRTEVLSMHCSVGSSNVAAKTSA